MDDSSQSTQDSLPPRVMLLLRSLNRGGAETQAVTLARALHARGWPVTVACFYTGGALEPGLVDAGVPLISLGKRGRWDVMAFLFRLWRVLRQEQPNILHGYLPTPNLLATLMRLFFPKMRVVWGVRASNMDLRQYDWLTRTIYWLERRCSRYADLVIANSESGARLRIAEGFPEAAMRVIPNGIDTNRFRFDAEGRERVRREWKTPGEATLVGLVGRLDPMKDHPTFLAAAASLAARNESWCFVCVGDGPAAYKAGLVNQANALGLNDRLIWAGARDDMAAVYSALDIVASSSSGEGFANVIAEAMACGRPCVVTDVGDSAMIGGGFATVIPPRDSAALADGVERMRMRILDAQSSMRIDCRQRVVDQFGVATFTQRTEDVLISVLGRPPSARTSPTSSSMVERPNGDSISD